MKKKLTLLLVIVMLLTLTASCGGTETPDTSPTPDDATDVSTPGGDGDVVTPVSGNALNVCIASEPETLDPNMESSVDGATYAHHMFEGLMKYVATGDAIGTDSKLMDTAIVPGQASGYTASADGLEYTFTLRDDIFWSDGEPVVAADFEYSWKRIVDPALAADYGYILDGIVTNASAIQAGDVDPSELGITAVDEKTLVITLEAECPYFIELCAFAALMPLRQDVIETHGAEWTNPGNCISNGAFVLTEWVHDSYIKMLPNEHYYDAANIVPESITWWLSDSQTAMQAAFASGVYDFYDDPPTDQIELLQNDGVLFITPYVGTYYVYLNVEHITDWRVRAAMTLAVDREYVVEFVTQGGQVPATGFVPNGISTSTGDEWTDTVGEPMYARLAELYPDYDLSDYADRCELAQQLFQEAVDDGWDANKTLTYNFNTSESHKVIAEALQSDWTTVLGISCTLSNQDWNVYTDGLAEGNFDIGRLGWIADYNDAVTYLELITNGNSYNYGRWVSNEYTSLINSAKALPGSTERDNYLIEAEALHFSEEGFTILPVYFYTNLYCSAKNLEGIQYTAFGYYFFHYASKS